jgi:hypothetical protein
MEENKELIAKGDQELSDEDLEAVSGAGINNPEGSSMKLPPGEYSNVVNKGVMLIG